MQATPTRERSTFRTSLQRTLGVGAILVSLHSTGCFEAGTAPQSTGNVAPAADVLSLAEIQSLVGLRSEQTALLATAHESWRRAEAAWVPTAREPGEPPVLGFIAASASVLDRDQLGRLIVALQGFEAGRVGDLGPDDVLFGPEEGRGPGGGRGHGHRGRGPGGDPFASLGLTQEQLDQVHAAQHTLDDSLHALVGRLRSGSLTVDAFEAAVEAARAAFETTIQGILTAEQYAALQQARREHLIARLEERLARFDTEIARRVEVLDVVLELSDAQVAQVQTILADSKASIQAVLAGLQDGSLSPQQAQDALAQADRDTTAAIRATLTEAQAAIFDRLVSLRRLFPGCRP